MYICGKLDLYIASLIKRIGTVMKCFWRNAEMARYCYGYMSVVSAFYVRLSLRMIDG